MYSIEVCDLQTAEPGVEPTWRDRADDHRFLAARHKAEAQDRVPSHLHQARGGGHPIQVDLLQGAALRHLAGKHRRG